MEQKLKSKLDSNIVKFQTKIKNNFQLFCFSKDAIIYFSKFHKLEFKDYKFIKFADRFKNIAIKNTPEIKEIKQAKIIDYGNNLIKTELANLVFILNMSDFEAWLYEFLNLIFCNDHKTLLRYLNLEKTPVNLSLIEQSKNIEEVWQGIINKYLFNKFYDRKDEILENLLSASNIKLDDDFNIVIGKINENFLCRNLIVHNKKKVNEDYLSKSKKFARFKNVGEIIDISEEYLFDQGDNLLFFMQNIRKKL